VCLFRGTGLKPQLVNLKKVAADAIRSISKELTWKVHFEKSQCEERAADVAAQGMVLVVLSINLDCFWLKLNSFSQDCITSQIRV